MSEGTPRHAGHDPRDAAVEIVRTLQDEGHTAYLAGGCVRDRLLGRPAKDYDVATDATPAVVRKTFRKTQYVGEAFGVVLVHLWRSRVEVATFRTEWGYEDGRRPTHVEFSDAQHDAQRRDFTVNGLFEDPIADQIIDYVGGQADLQAGVIRAIGDPDERFGEDYLRMLRAPRFAAALKFKIDKRTAAAIRRHADKLGLISRERIGQEVMSMLTGTHPPAAARLIQQLQLDAATLDEPHQNAPLATMRRLDAQAAYATVLAAWAIDRDVAGHDAQDFMLRVAEFIEQRSPNLIKRWRRSLCLSNDHSDALRRIMSSLAAALTWPTLGVARRKRMLAQQSWPATWALLQALRRTGVGQLSDLVRTIRPEAKVLQAQGVAPEPLLSGDDLIALGHQPSPDFGTLLQQLYDAQLEGAVTTRDDALAWLHDNSQR